MIQNRQTKLFLTENSFAVQMNNSGFFCKHCSIVMRYLKQTKITINISKNSTAGVNWRFVSNVTQNFNNLYFMICPFLSFLRHCSINGYNRQITAVLVNFPKKFSFFKQKENLDPIWSKIIQSYIKLTAIEIFRNILA